MEALSCEEGRSGRSRPPVTPVGSPFHTQWALHGTDMGILPSFHRWGSRSVPKGSWAARLRS